ncbi:MAG: fibronectin type III domain-containing protein [Microbacteriaceae bacterium]|nr:fibronectin type III domain-containing protein [Microbacteriaceae bacterium]
MTYSPTRRFLIAIGQILFITATSLSVPLWPTQPASATIAAPSSLSSTTAPAGLIINSPWVADASGTEWAYGTTSASMGTLISRNRTTGAFTSREVIAGDEGSIAGLYSPLSNVAVFSARRTGLGNRITAFDLTTGTRISSRTLAPDETLIRALAFTSGADSYIVGTNQNPAKVMKFATTTGALEYSSTLPTGLKEITAFIPNGTELLAAVNTIPIKLVSVTRNRLVVGSVLSLPTGTPTLMDPVVVGTTAYLGTDANPGRITAIDIPTKTVIGSATLNTGETGARNLVVDDSTGTLYATTDSAAGPRIASFQLTDLRRLGMTQLSAGSSATSLLLSGEKLTVGFSGTRGVETFTVAPEPNAPVITGIQESDSSLTVEWNSGGSVEPIIEYTVSVAAGTFSASCSTNGTTCTIRGLNNGTTYSISVVARSVAGVSQATLTSGVPRTVPDAPSTPRVTRGNADVTVTWTPQGDGGVPITGYRATASPSGQMCESIVQSCTISGLPNGIPQTVRVVAHNSVGTSQPSAPSASVTPATVPDPPTSLRATATERGAELEWSAAAHDGGDPVTGYRVRIWREAVIVAEFDQSTTSASVPGLTGGVAYRVTVTSVNNLGESVTLETAFVTPISPPVVDPPVVDPPPTFDPPSPPVDVTVIGTTGKNVTVGWRPGDSNGAPVIDFIVHVSQNKNRGFAVWPDSTSATPTVELPKPRRGKLYVRVITVTVLGESAPSQVTLVARARN